MVSIPTRPIQVVGDAVTREVDTIADLYTVYATSPGDDFATTLLGYHAIGDGGGQQLYYDAGSSATVDGGFVFPGVGGVLSFDAAGVFNGTAGDGRWLAIETDEIIAKRWGAIDDGSTDNVLAFKRITNAVNADTGETLVRLDGDTYDYSDGLQFEEEVNLYGNGILNYTGTGRAISFGPNGLTNVTTRNHENYTLEGITLTGGGSATHGVFVNHFVTLPRFRDVKVDDFGTTTNYAFWFEGNNWDIQFESCRSWYTGTAMRNLVRVNGGPDPATGNASDFGQSRLRMHDCHWHKNNSAGGVGVWITGKNSKVTACTLVGWGRTVVIDPLAEYTSVEGNNVELLSNDAIFVEFCPPVSEGGSAGFVKYLAVQDNYAHLHNSDYALLSAFVKYGESFRGIRDSRFERNYIVDNDAGEPLVYLYNVGGQNNNFVDLNTGENPMIPHSTGSNLTSFRKHRKHVDNIASLTNIGASDGEGAQVDGYYTAGDGGGQQLYYSASSTATIDGGFVFPGVGGDDPSDNANWTGTTFSGVAGTGRWLAVETGEIHLPRWGTKDGTDSWRQTQSAFNAASTEYDNSGRAIPIIAGRGNFLLSQTVSYDAAITNDYLSIAFRGQGRGQTVFQTSSSFTGTALFEFNDRIYRGDVRDMRLNCLNGGTRVDYGIHVTNECSRSSFSFLNIVDSNIAGVRIEDQWTNNFTSVFVQQSQKHGFYMPSGVNNQLTFNNCTAVGCLGAGYAISGGLGIQFLNSNAETCQQVGWYLNAAAGVTWTGCYAESNGQTGFSLAGYTGVNGGVWSDGTGSIVMRSDIFLNGTGTPFDGSHDIVDTCAAAFPCRNIVVDVKSSREYDGQKILAIGGAVGVNVINLGIHDGSAGASGGVTTPSLWVSALENLCDDLFISDPAIGISQIEVHGAGHDGRCSGAGGLARSVLANTNGCGSYDVDLSQLARITGGDGSSTIADSGWKHRDRSVYRISGTQGAHYGVTIDPGDYGFSGLPVIGEMEYFQAFNFDDIYAGALNGTGRVGLYSWTHNTGSTSQEDTAATEITADTTSGNTSITVSDDSGLKVGSVLHIAGDSASRIVANKLGSNSIALKAAPAVTGSGLRAVVRESGETGQNGNTAKGSIVTTGTASASSTTITVADPLGMQVGDVLTINDGGATAGAFASLITGISGSVVTLAESIPSAVTSTPVATAPVRKVQFVATADGSNMRVWCGKFLGAVDDSILVRRLRFFPVGSAATDTTVPPTLGADSVPLPGTVTIYSGTTTTTYSPSAQTAAAYHAAAVTAFAAVANGDTIVLDDAEYESQDGNPITLTGKSRVTIKAVDSHALRLKTTAECLT